MKKKKKKDVKVGQLRVIESTIVIVNSLNGTLLLILHFLPRQEEEVVNVIFEDLSSGPIEVAWLEENTRTIEEQ